MRKIKTNLKRKLLIAFIFLNLNLFSQVAVPYNTAPCGLNNWKIVWMDDFNFLDLTKWRVQDNEDAVGCASVAIDDNVNVFGGQLKIDVKKENYQCPIDVNGNTSYYCYNQKNSSNPYIFSINIHQVV